MRGRKLRKGERKREERKREDYRWCFIECSCVALLQSGHCVPVLDGRGS